MTLNNNFAASGPTTIPSGVQASGDFYDFKNSLFSKVNISLVNTNRQITRYTIRIVYGQVSSEFNATHSLSDDSDDNTIKNLEIEIVHSSDPSTSIKDNTIEYNFSNLLSYKIFHLIEIKELVLTETKTYNLTYTQNFRYYETPVTLSNFTFSRQGTSDADFKNGDNIQISGLILNHGANNPIDTTIPESVTLQSGIVVYPILFTIQEDVVSTENNDAIEYIQYETAYVPSGNYILEDVQLTTGKTYKINANATWKLGYSTDTESTQKLSILERPKVTAVDIKSLYVNNVNNDIVDITIGAITASSLNPVSKIWFEFYNTSDTLVAKAGGASGISINTGSNVYTLKLSSIAVLSSGGILNDSDYKVKALIKYTTDHYRRSDPFPEVASEYIKFTKSVPTIVSHTIHSLYTSDPTKNILTIDVKKEAYQLYAPNSANGIKFHFYDAADTATIVASTSSYTFVNSTGTGNVSYPILLSEVTPGVLVNNKDYRIKAEVTLVKHSGVTEQRTSLLSSDASPVDKVNFTENLPDIVSHTIHSLYTSDPTKNILTIDVKKEAYQLYAPNSANGIKFHFYDAADTATIVASTSSYTFVNSTGTGNVSYPILLSEVTPGVLVNNKDYRIKAEVTLVKHSGVTEQRTSLLSSDASPVDKVNFSLKTPFISSLTAYDFQVDSETDSIQQVIANIVVRKELYELVAPNSVNGIRFLIYNSDATKLIAKTTSYTFQNSSSNINTEYSIKLNEVTIETGEDPLSNGTIYKVKAEVTIIKHSGDTELRLSAEFKDLKGSQDIAPITNVTISNTWALATNNNPSSSSTRFDSSPIIGISGYFKKTPQFNGGNNATKHLDLTSTKFKMEYQIGEGSWTNVQKAVLLQKSSSESLEEAVSRVNAASVVSSQDGQYVNVVGSGVGTSQENMIFFIPQQQVTGTNTFTESNKVKVRVTIIDTENIWGLSSSSSVARDSNSTQLINKINKYDFVNGSNAEPWNTLDGSNLVLNIPVDWASIHAHSVKVGYKYASGDSYTYQTFGYTTSTAQINVDPTSGTTLYYSVVYIVKNDNINVGATTEGLTIEKDVPNTFFPSSSDYSVTNTSYNTFNTGAKSSITFNLTFSPASTSRVDGVNVYFTSPSSSQGSNIVKTRIATYLSTQGGNGKTIQLLYTNSPSTINYATTLNSTLLNVMNSSGQITTTTGVIWGDYDMANISFEAYRDRRVNSTSASYGNTNYIESGLNSFDKTIWNVPVLSAPSSNGSITLTGGVRNSSSDTKLTWTGSSDANSVNFKYDLTMMKNADSSLIHNDSGLSLTEKVLTIDTTANAKYTITLKNVFAPSTTGSMREVSAHDTITFHTIHVNVSSMNILVQHPSNTSSVSLSWVEPTITGDSVTMSGSESASFTTNISEHFIKYSTTNPTNALTRLASSGSNVIERIVSPATIKGYSLPVTSLKTKYSFFMHIGAVIKYKVNTTIVSTSSVNISDQTTTSSGSQYIVSSVPIINTPTISPVIASGQLHPTLSLGLDANGLEDEGFISVLVILGQDGTQTKIEGEGVLLLFPDTGANFDISSANLLGGLGSLPGDARLAANESYTTIPYNISSGQSTMSTGSGDYVLTIGGVNSVTGRYGNSTLKMPPTSTSNFSNGEVNYMIAVTTRRGTNFGVGTFTYAPTIVENINISQNGSDYFVNFNINTL